MNDPILLEVVKMGVMVTTAMVVVRGLDELGSRVNSLLKHSSNMRLPRCASYSSFSDDTSSASTFTHAFSTLSSICLTPATQGREQLCPLVKSSLVQP